MSDLYFDSGKGIYKIPESSREQAEKLGWKPVDAPPTPDGRAPGQAFTEGGVEGAVNTFTAPARAAAGLGEAVAGKNVVSDTIKQANGENALGALHTVGSFLGDVPSAISEGRLPQAESYADTEKYTSESRKRAAEHPLAHGAGVLAGSLAGFGPVGGIGGAIAGTGGTAAAVAGGAAEGATLSLADATEEARRQDTALKMGDALFAGGLGGLFGGTLSFAGRKMSAALARRAETTAHVEAPGAPTGIPDLEAPAPQGGVRMPEGISGYKPQNAPKPADEMGPSTIPAPPLPPEAELAGQAPPLPEEGLGIRTPRPGLEQPPTIPAPPTTNADLMAGRPPAPNGLAGRARYAPETAEGTEQGLGGLPGGPDVEEDLARAGRAEALHMQRRVDKVKKLLEPIPEGAHPDWLLKWTPHQREALADYVGVPSISDTTWRALADALAEREGLPISEHLATATEHLHSDELEGQLRASLADKVGAPRGGTMLPPPEPAVGTADINAPAPGTYAGPPRGTAPLENPDPASTVPNDINAPAPGTFQGKVISPETMTGPPDVIGEAPSAKKDFDSFATKIMRYGARRAAGRIVGGVGGALLGGPVGSALGYAAGAAAEKLAGNAAVERWAAKGASAIDGALKGFGRGAPRVASPFMSGFETPEAAFTARATEIRNTTDQGIIEKVAKAFGDSGDPSAMQVAVETAKRGMTYLASKLPSYGPDPGSLTPQTDSRMPSRAEIRQFGDVYDAVHDPAGSVLPRIQDGTVTKDQMAALATVYPPAYAKLAHGMGNHLIARDVRAESLWPTERRTAATVLGIPAGIDSPDFAKKFGPGFAMKAEQAKQAQAGAGRQLHSKAAIPSSLNTTTNSLLSP